MFGTHVDRFESVPWSPEEVAAIARAVTHAPSVYNIQPWSLSFQDRTVTLHERYESGLGRHDPQGRERQISCGAALANLILAVRNIGWMAEVSLPGSDDSPGVVANVTGTHQRPPTDTERERFQVITERTSYRRPFDTRPVAGRDRAALADAATAFPVHARWITGQREALDLARLLTYAARAHHGDYDYQRELVMWIGVGAQAEHPGRGLPADALGTRGLPAVGLVTAITHVPDEHRLASCIEAESVLLLNTPTHTRLAQVQAGEALETTWLEATRLGLAASVMTQPLQLSEVRSRLAQRLELPAVPQVLMRFGHPAPPVPRSSRRPLEEIFTDEL